MDEATTDDVAGGRTGGGDGSRPLFEGPESETRFREIFEQVANIPVQGYDHCRRVIYWNAASERVYGYTRDEAMGRRIEDLIMPDGFREIAVRLMDDWIAGGPAIPAGEIVLINKSGAPVPVYSSHVMIRNARGEPEMYCIDVDMSAQRRLEEQLRQAQKMEAVGRLAGGIAHDFNNLLMVMHGNLEFARAGLPPDSAVRRDVQEIQDAASRATELTRQLLAFSRRQSLTPGVLDLNVLATTMRTLLGRLVGDEIRLDIRTTQDPLWTVADVAQMEQVLMNLAVNARDAMPQGGHLLIETGRGRIDGKHLGPPSPDGAARGEVACVRLTVRDTGLGMSEAIVAHLFEPYFTTKDIGQGTGLGLSIVYGIVKQHGGHVTVDSEPGRGSAFHIFLPETGPASVQPQPGAAVEAGPAARGTVLVAEDEPAVLSVLQRILTDHGYTVEACTDPRIAARRAESLGASLDLLLADVGMPGMNGARLAVAVRTACPRAEIVFLTGYPEPRLRELGIDPAVEQVIHKPISRAALLTAVGTAMERRADRA